MAFIYWTLTALAVIIDLWVIHALRRRGARCGMYLYGVFALLTDVVTRGVPYITALGKWQSLIPVFLSYVFLLTASVKVLIAGGWLLDKRRGRGSKRWLTASVVASVVFLGVMIAGTISPTRGICVKRVELCFDNLPDGFDGERIGFFTDMHLGSLTAANKILQQVVDSLNAAECLIVVNGGDLINIHNSELKAERRRALSEINSPVYSVIGNHDLGYYRRDTLQYTVAQSTADFKAAVDSLGWRRLDNSSVWIYSPTGDSLRLTGVEFNRRAADDRHKRTVGGVNIDSLVRADIPEGVFSIVVSHIPQYWHSLCDTHAADLTLAGHTHAMQCKVRIGECKWSPAALLYDEWGGLYHEGHKKLYISEGVGFAGIPIRLGTPPSITIITLRKCE
ncbi:MAG: metallophosphoesterase [Rikenellaceae bacterium]|nr:metallophosphoesterase [Rikenellaceae bacterium]